MEDPDIFIPNFKLQDEPVDPVNIRPQSQDLYNKVAYDFLDSFDREIAYIMKKYLDNKK